MTNRDRKLVTEFALKSMAKKGFPSSHDFVCTSQQKLNPRTVFLGSKQKFYSLTVFRLDQYLPHGSKKMVKKDSNTGHSRLLS